MEKSKLHHVLFTLGMAFVMVYAMICYNIALHTGQMSNAVFMMAFHELWIMWPIAIIIELFFVEKWAVKLAIKKFHPEQTSPQLFQMTICTMIVCLMCPIMSFIATVLFQNAGTQMIAVWLQTTAFNFPMALAWQLFFGGAVVRKLESLWMSYKYSLND